MEFSTVGAEDSLDEARKRLEEVECLVVFGSKDTIVGVITEVEINRIPGVVENGLFVGRVDRVIVGTADGIRTQDRQV